MLVLACQNGQGQIKSFDGQAYSLVHIDLHTDHRLSGYCSLDGLKSKDMMSRKFRERIVNLEFKITTNQCKPNLYACSCVFFDIGYRPTSRNQEIGISFLSASHLSISMYSYHEKTTAMNLLQNTCIHVQSSLNH